MTRRIAIAAVVGLAALPALAGEPAAPRPPPIAVPPLEFPRDLDELARRSKTVVLDPEVLHEALVTGHPDAVVFSAALDLGDGVTAIAWSECSEAGCRAWLASLTGGAEFPRLGKKISLVAPARVFGVDGFAFEAPALADLDGDGAREIILRYKASEPPRRALGSLSHDYLAVHAPKDLALMFSHELWRTGGSTETACQWTLGRDGNRLIAHGRCNVPSCLGPTPEASCQATKELIETWRKLPGQKRYVRVSR